MTLAALARRNARLYPDKPAYVMGGRRVTFGEYNQRVNRLVHAVDAMGVGPGDRVAVLSRNSLEYLDIYGAAEKGGFALAPLNFRLTAGELQGVLANIDPRILFVQTQYLATGQAVAESHTDVEVVVIDGPAPPGWRSLEDLLATGSSREPDREPAPQDVCYLMCTSGTTGTPRAAMLTHQGQWLDALALALEMRLSPGDRHLATMPFFHVGGRAVVLAHTLRGCTVHLQDGFDAERVTSELASSRITTTQVVPTMVSLLLDQARTTSPLPGLRMVFYASAPMPVGLLRRAIERFGPVFVQGYGQTESGPLATSLQPDEHVLDGIGSERLTSCGRAVPGVEVRIVGEEQTEQIAGEVGEIEIRSPFNMAGYWRQPELTKRTLVAGWLRTGDIGRIDELGYLFIVDRKKDMIISGGENIYPREVEDILRLHPAVVEAAVIGIPDETWGESPLALVVTRSGYQGDVERELTAFCRERLAHYKCPKAIQSRSSLPITPTGKVLKRALREPYWREQPAAPEALR